MGPLKGVRVIEMAGIGPAPFAAMMLADMGAEVIRVDRKVRADTTTFDVLKNGGFLNRGRRSIALDLKKPEAVPAFLQLVAKADALIEGFRPGVMERLGLGPDACHALNPRLVYGRITGWGQNGPYANMAGHDINYISVSGALHAIGSAGAPAVPLNMIGDFGGGGMLIAMGVLAALLEARASGRGQVVDAAMTDGVAQLLAMQYAFKAMGHWNNERADNLFDGGAPFYGVYACADGKFLSVGALEQQFHDILIDKLGLSRADFADRWDKANWPRLKAIIAGKIATRTRDAWCAVFDGSDACVTPVLDFDEASRHSHNAARETFMQRDGAIQPTPAPRFSRTPSAAGTTAATPGADSVGILADWGFTPDDISALERAQVI